MGYEDIEAKLNYYASERMHQSRKLDKDINDMVKSELKDEISRLEKIESNIKWAARLQKLTIVLTIVNVLTILLKRL